MKAGINTKRGVTIRGTRFKIIVESHNGRRASFRVRLPGRPYQINLTLTRYVPAKHIKGVS